MRQLSASWTFFIKVRLHGRRQAARLPRDMLQHDLLRGNSVYMVGSCRARLLHIIHVASVYEVGVLQEKCSRQPVLRGNFKFKLKMPPGLAAVVRLLRAACRRVNAPVVFLCFYFAARLSRHSHAACRVPCKHSFTMTSDERHVVSNTWSLTVCLTAYVDPYQTNIKVYITGSFGENSLFSGKFPTQRASNEEKASIWWHHHVLRICLCQPDGQLSA